MTRPTLAAVLLALAGGCSFDAGGSGRPGDGGPLTDGPALTPDAPPPGPFLTGSRTPLAATRVNLGADGPSDWIHLAFADKDDVDRKLSGGLQLTFSVLGGGEKRVTQAITFVWDDGTPRRSGESNSALAVDVFGRGITILAPAGPDPRRLRIYVAGENAGGRLRATLSGAAVPEYIDDMFGGTSFTGMYELNYRGSEGQLVTATFTLAADLPGGSNVSVSSVTLQ